MQGTTGPWLAVGQWTEDSVVLQPLTDNSPQSLLRRAHVTMQGTTEPWLAVGQWTEDSVVLQPLTDNTPQSLLRRAHFTMQGTTEPWLAVGQWTVDSVVLQPLTDNSPQSLLRRAHFTVQGTTEPWLAVGQWTEDSVVLQPLTGNSPQCRLRYAEAGQPRCMLSAEMHSTRFLFTGTSLGWVVMHPLRWDTGQLKGGVGYKVHAGISPVSLSWLPSSDAATGCVYAQSSRALLLRPASDHEDPSGQLHTAVEAVRVHGGEGIQAAVPIHTPDLPDSLAWLSATEQLTFGKIDHQVKLRWHTLGLEDTPKHMAYHSSSGYAATLSSNNCGTSWLRLVEAFTLTKVAAVQLEPGHKPTAIGTARLPCSSVAALHRMPGPAAAEKEFILVATCTDSSDGERAGAGQSAQQGFLSVFEIGIASQSKHASPRNELKLHGTCQLAKPCLSLAAATAPNGTGMSQCCQTNHAAQIVLTGCEGQVLAYSITVDDTAQTAQRALATALKALSQTEPMPALSCPDCAQPASTIQAKAAPGNSNMQQLAQTCVQRLSDPNWGQKVQLKLLCQANTAGDTGLVTDLSVQGSAVLASSYMTSVTVLTLQQQSDKLCLKAVSACTDPCSGSDASPDVAAAHGAVKDDSAAFPVQAAVLVDDALVLAGMYPERLLLLRRDKAEEMAVLNARHSRLLTPTSGARDQIEVQQEGTVTETDAISLVQLIIAADCWSSQAAGKLFQAKLGVQFSELAKTGEAYKEASDICSRVVLTACTSDGSIVEVCLDKASIGS